MKLRGVTNINYNINEELQRFAVERLIEEIGDEIAPIVAGWYVLNESTNRYEIDQDKLNEGIKDIIKGSANKINNIMMKGRVELDILKSKVVDKLKGKLDNGTLSKLGALAKKNAKYVKPALMIAVVGTSLLGMDTASAADTINQMDQLDGQELSGMIDQTNQSAEPAMGQAAPADTSPEMINNMKNVIGKQFIGAQINGQAADGSDIAKAMNMIKIDGTNFDNYLTQAIDYAQQKGLSPKSLISNIQNQVDNQMLDALSKVMQKRG